ncbi:hypothetical protein BDQ12DRAFT_609191 [Crucibulum laeve]|uniref:C2H2-type domain-containing protein n=1 Tax=Crucibulum laeve TaxID=68775 RepID=A0A5C3LWF6_9AGAR|nr:hypothetical protein BDQ12DRAFT_609191 [Crucibulum laeve]
MHVPPIASSSRYRKQVGTAKTTEASKKRRKNGEQGEFVCVDCGRDFTTKFNLEYHMRSHTDDRPFKCPEPGCQSCFRSKSDCSRHYAKVHNKKAL